MQNCECGQPAVTKGRCHKCYMRAYYLRTTEGRQRRKDMPQTCSECPDKVRAKGLCNKHYQRHYGCRTPRQTRDMSGIDRFHYYVNKTESCWLWTGATTGRYGTIFFNGRNRSTHRVSYEIHKGHIPPRALVCHSCDNPKCVNPAHLFIGTSKDNTQDMMRKGRGRWPSGSDHHCAKLSDDDILEIKSMQNSHSQREIANKFSVNQSHISRILRGLKSARVIKPTSSSLA